MKNQNIAIADSLGFEMFESPTYVPHPCGRGHMRAECKNPDGYYCDIPSYTTDLNACHYMEEGLGSRWHDYAISLTGLLGEYEWGFATAQQRADAYCKVMRLKWEDEE